MLKITINNRKDVHRFHVRAQLLQLMLVAGLLFLLPLPVDAKQDPLSISGYAKNLSLRGRSPFTRNSYLYSMTRLRTEASFSPSESIQIQAQLDTEARLGNFINTIDYHLAQELAPVDALNLTWQPVDGQDFKLSQNLFRAVASFVNGNFEMRLGRQRIAWGTGFIWNPTDQLNPTDPLSFEREEKQGVDALFSSLAIGDFSGIEMAFAPGPDFEHPSLALRLRSKMAQFDFSVLGGSFQKRIVTFSPLDLIINPTGFQAGERYYRHFIVGADFAGYLGGAGFRGEFSFTKNQENDDDFLQAVLNLDYNFPGDYYVMAEFYSTGEAANYSFGAGSVDVEGQSTGNSTRRYLAASMSKNVTPLLRFDLYAIVNLTDRSRLFGPGLAFSISDNIDFAFSSYLLGGDAGTELGSLESTLFLSLQYYY